MSFLKKRPWIAVALVVACICMWGCEYLGEEPKLVESGSRKGEGFAMVSDTTALLAVYYYELYEWSSGGRQGKLYQDGNASGRYTRDGV